jgi:hypothetical protein
VALGVTSPLSEGLTKAGAVLNPFNGDVDDDDETLSAQVRRPVPSPSPRAAGSLFNAATACGKRVSE